MSVTIENNILKGPPLSISCPDQGIGWMVFNNCIKYANKICHISHVGPGPYDYKSETFGSFKDRSTRIAEELLRRGAESQDVVINCSPNNYDNGLTTAACFYIGVLPSTIDPTLSDRECAHLLGSMEPRFIFVHKSVVDLINRAIEMSGIKTQVIIQGCEEDDIMQENHINFLEFLKKDASDFRPRITEDLEETCIILYSSGSTGFSKGICISHRALFFGTMTFMDIHDTTTCMLHYSTFYWISGIMLYMGSFILGHCRLGGAFYSPEGLCRLIEEHKVTTVFLASAVVYQLESLPELLQQYDISSLRTISVAGGPVTAEQMMKLRKWLPKVNVFLAYGMTEVAGCVSGFIGDDKGDLLDYPSSCGRPLHEMLIKFVDPETSKTLPHGELGELLFKPPARMKLYYRHTEDLTKCFDSDGFYKTGDLGYYNEQGLLFVSDRIRDMFKYMNFHIVPAAVEAVLKRHPAVLECVVFGVPDEVAEHLPAAAVVLKPNFNTTKKEILEFIDTLLIDREKLRGGLYFVKEVPKTPSGKIQRRKVRDMMLAEIKNGI